MNNANDNRKKLVPYYKSLVRKLNSVIQQKTAYLKLKYRKTPNSFKGRREANSAVTAFENQRENIIIRDKIVTLKTECVDECENGDNIALDRKGDKEGLYQQSS